MVLELFNDLDNCVIVVCLICLLQLNDESEVDVNYWCCLNDVMWFQVLVVQVVLWWMLKQFESEIWVQDLFDMLYFDDDILEWVKVGIDDRELMLDSNGDVFKVGDFVYLIKDFIVKGVNFIVKCGILV